MSTTSPRVLPYEFELQRPYMHQSGHAWRADARDVRWASDLPGRDRSSLQVLEDGVPLGPAHSAHARVQVSGGGAYSHWGGEVLFSTSDNSDPNLNGREYRAILVRAPDWSPLCMAGCHVHCHQMSLFDEFVKVDVEILAEGEEVVGCDLLVGGDKASLRQTRAGRTRLVARLLGRQLPFSAPEGSTMCISKRWGASAVVLPQILDGAPSRFMRLVTSAHVDWSTLGHRSDSERARAAMDLFDASVVRVRRRGGENVDIPLPEIAASHWSFLDPARARLADLMAPVKKGVFLEIGGRGAQSLAVRESLGGDWRYVGFDIKPGDNVDLVGDVHMMSSLIERASVDVVYSLSVFEHLFMPWRAVLEINKVLKLGGLCYVHAPYFWGVHEEPWDFFRSSRYAWPALFNRGTGFEILYSGDLGVSRPIAQVANRLAVEAGFATGPMATVALARKIGDSTLSWDGYDPAAVAGMYPG